MSKPVGKDVSQFGLGRSSDGSTMRRLVEECSQFTIPSNQKVKPKINENISGKFDAKAFKEYLIDQLQHDALRDVLERDYGSAPEVTSSGNVIRVAIANFGEVTITLK